LKKLHAETLRARAHSVIVECDELYFMSSACIKCLVTWIDGILKLEPIERYKVKFQANAKLSWQRRSFEALRRFAPALVHIEFDSTSHTAAPRSATLPPDSGPGSSPTMPAASPSARRKL
jgi:hypothetical protein